VAGPLAVGAASWAGADVAESSGGAGAAAVACGGFAPAALSRHEAQVWSAWSSGSVRSSPHVEQVGSSGLGAGAFARSAAAAGGLVGADMAGTCGGGRWGAMDVFASSGNGTGTAGGGAAPPTSWARLGTALGAAGGAGGGGGGTRGAAGRLLAGATEDGALLAAATGAGAFVTGATGVGALATGGTVAPVPRATCWWPHLGHCTFTAPLPTSASSTT
jgi:hypothetical protein